LGSQAYPPNYADYTQYFYTDRPIGAVMLIILLFFLNLPSLHTRIFGYDAVE
jgi:hypothetical protein